MHNEQSLGQALRGRILGQEHAIDALLRAVTIGRSGLGDPNRPVASLLFVGPTGVGKTELVRALAVALHGDQNEYCRIDMAALAQEHYVASLAGAPPGYAGSKEGLTLLNRELIERPDGTPGIVLFDEIEKAHATVIRSLLHILDNGTLHLAGGKDSYSFRRAVVVMTSNVGTGRTPRRPREKRSGSFSEESRLTESVVRGRSNDTEVAAITQALERAFDAEFLNRCDEVVLFDPINRTTAESIVERELAIVGQSLRRRQVEVRIHPSVVAWIADRGFDPIYGARGIARVIRREVLYPIARCIDSQHPDSGVLRVEICDDRIVCSLPKQHQNFSADENTSESPSAREEARVP